MGDKILLFRLHFKKTFKNPCTPCNTVVHYFQVLFEAFYFYKHKCQH